MKGRYVSACAAIARGQAARYLSCKLWVQGYAVEAQPGGVRAAVDRGDDGGQAVILQASQAGGVEAGHDDQGAVAGGAQRDAVAVGLGRGQIVQRLDDLIVGQQVRPGTAMAVAHGDLVPLLAECPQLRSG